MLEVRDGLSQASTALDFRLTGSLRLWNELVGIGIGDKGCWAVGWVLEGCATWCEPQQL